MNSERKPFHEVVADKLIKQLGEGTAPWQKPWDAGHSGTFMPINPTTGKRYKGINAIHLMSEGREDQRWMTYKQAEGAGARVRKGEHGTQIQYWQFDEEQSKLDADGKPVVDNSGAAVKVQVQLERPRVFLATVFNAEQIENLPPPLPRKAHSWTAVERAEHIMLTSGAVVLHGERDRAFYRHATDCIHLPDKDRFPSADNYYATALHELGHWTGHPSRLDRDLAHPFGSDGYAREELRAEIASMMLGDELGIGHDPGQHAAYVGSWIRVLQENPLEIFRAAADAEKIQEYFLGLELQQTEERCLNQSALVVESQETNTDVTQSGTLEQTAMERAEIWTLKRLENRDLCHAVDQSNATQLKGMLRVLTDMSPLTTSNPFWQRHELPETVDGLRSQIASASRLIDLRQSDWPVASAWQTLSANETQGPLRQKDRAALDLASQEILGCLLPYGWTGDAWTRMDIPEEFQGQLVVAPELPAYGHAFSWGVYGLDGQGNEIWLTRQPTGQHAEALIERLQWIDAHAMKNEHEKAARFAQLNEDRVRRDPDRTDEDVVVAREIRKDAYFAAATNDADLQRRIAFEQIEALNSSTTAMTTDGIRTFNEPSRLLISVPYREKDEAKALGAKWDRKEQSWYLSSGIDTGPFAKWMPARPDDAAPGPQQPSPAADSQQVERPVEDRQYLAVPYRARTEARAAGAQWDPVAKSWYAGNQADMARLTQWKPENVHVQQGPAMTPKKEFAEALRSLGCVVGGDHPVMDGKTHRISVQGERFSKHSGSGFYVVHLDGHPAGYIKNNRTGTEMNWKSKGYVLDPVQKMLLAASAANKLEMREAAVLIQQEQAATRVQAQIQDLVPASEPTAYMRAKGIDAHPGAMTDRAGKKTYLPVVDVSGKQWSMQYILENGSKRFAKNSRKEGCFHVLGEPDALDRAPALVISEGYATAAQLRQALGYATVSAFDSGNLAAVAQALHKKYPDKPVIIAGDDDRHLEMTYGTNPGRSKAEEAAALVGGKMLLPIFAPEENSFPSSVRPVTPADFIAHQKTGDVLTAEQLAALARMKQFTDFNDLASRSQLGRGAVERQIRTFVQNEISKESQRMAETVRLQRDETHQFKRVGLADENENTLRVSVYSPLQLPISFGREDKAKLRIGKL